MGSLSITHWLILLVIIVLVFGTGKLKNFGKDMGGAVKGFKEAMKDDADTAKINQSQPIEGEAKQKETDKV